MIHPCVYIILVLLNDFQHFKSFQKAIGMLINVKGTAYLDQRMVFHTFVCNIE